MMEFHISRVVRDRYQFDKSIYSINGNVIFANFHAARLFAQKINQKRDLIHFPEQAVKAGQINALGLIDEILHFVFFTYKQEKKPNILDELMDHLEAQFGQENINRLLFEFCVEFPPLAIYNREITIEKYLSEKILDVANRNSVLEELILLWVTNRNPAAISAFGELFDEKVLLENSKYGLILKETRIFFENQPHFGPENQNLIDMLRSPALIVPNSLPGQLEYIRTRWGILLGKYLLRLLNSLDLIKEEEKLGFSGGGGETQIPIYLKSHLDHEIENYSADKEWMPRVVLMAKNTLVWLDQLGKKYQRSINRLDQIPDEELEDLARRGFTGLWLIGLWERSQASAKIKQMCGNPDAVSSAYSLANYEIAEEIGGYAAYENLRERVWSRGIRLASDMVPNHMAIDSDWVVHDPDRFLSLPYSPYPAYTYQGPNLSNDSNIEIKIDDHYYNRTDAAVVFQRIDRRNGDTRYIYHGNDGTSMPWNDTAQLNYLNPETREAVIQTILDVARKFPIIRFDAAMTLARKHFQRLWFPEPGSGGDIPSRAEHSLPRDAFMAAMPQEFWREVVDRVAREAPDTLLLAEAFWLMEGYFVRSLGMHRVYNSAFMNMLRNEENAKFRQLLKNTLEYDPEILRRYVNFISNPDERTAVDQFGKGDKYFGTCTLMATLPGLPMFGHGQIEGFTEKYGMEYKRAYYEEQPDLDLVERHEREIFPLLRKRALFAGVEDFHLYDLFNENGGIDENTIVFTNGLGDERVLVAFHNHFSQTSGWLRVSSPFSKRASDGSRYLIQTSLSDGLNLSTNPGNFIIFREQNSGLEFIRQAETIKENGLYIQLNAFSCLVFKDFQVVQDDSTQSFRRICDTLNGEGVPSISDAIHEMFLQPVLYPLQEILNFGYLQYLDDQVSAVIAGKGTGKEVVFEEARGKIVSLVQGIATVRQTTSLNDQIVSDTCKILKLLFTYGEKPGKSTEVAAKEKKPVFILLSKDRVFRISLLSNVFLSKLGKLIDPDDYQNVGVSLFEEWRAGILVHSALEKMGFNNNETTRSIRLIKAMITVQDWNKEPQTQTLSGLLKTLLPNQEIQGLLQVNRYKDTLWFSKEGMEDLMMCLLLSKVFILEENDPTVRFEDIHQAMKLIKELKTVVAKSEYKIENLVQILEEPSNQAA